MTYNQKVLVVIGVTVTTVLLLFGKRGVASIFTFWPDKR